MPLPYLKLRRPAANAERPPSSKTRRQKLKTALFAVVLVGVGLLVVGGLAVAIALAWVSRDLPDPNTLMSRQVPLTTKMFDRTGTHLLYEIHGDENRTLVQIKDLPSYIPKATVSIEDKNFYTHHGIDWLGLVRAFLVNTLRGQRIKGTSTLTQQFVKNAILTNERTFTRKLKEILLSLQIERVYNKDQILQLYLNEIPYGSTIYGIESAAQHYFGKTSKDLTLDEAALLAAIPQAPDLYSPYGTGSHGDNRGALVVRQKYILDQMVAQGYITKDQTIEAKTVDTLKKIIPKAEKGLQAPHFVMYVRSQLIDKYGQTTVETKGLKVITTLDWDKQQIAQDEVKKGVDARGEKYQFTNAALVVLDPKTGQILSMVGSKDFFDVQHDGQVNVVLRPRQPGSSFKPIVYAAGFIKGYTPETTLWDVNTVFKTDMKNYEPKNYDLREHGPVSVRKALQGSLNIPAVKMLYLVGVSRVLDFADSLGYTTFADRSRFGLSLVLGGGEVTLLEHANAYATFANQGTQYPTASILKVEDSSGAALEEWTQPQGTQPVDKDTTNRISNVLSDNGARAFVFGTTNYLTLPGRPAATKTGTTNNFHDAWTLGYTPSLVAGVWVGNNNNDEMKRGADGSQIAAPIWQGFMKRALANAPVEKFTPPPPTDATKPVLLGRDLEVLLSIDKVSGKLASASTPPELIEQRPFHVAHDILFYVDKDDPRGPQPGSPGQDTQFANWEGAVQAWVQKNNWNTTSTPPTETDDMHTLENMPTVSIISPSANSTVSSRNVVFNITASAQRRIKLIDVESEGTIIGSTQSEPWTINAQFPNSISNGFHDVIVTAYDDVGNKGTATITINLIANDAAPTLHITNIQNGATFTQSSFPVTVSVLNSELSAKKIDLYLQTNDGSSKLLTSEISPATNQVQFVWNTNPGAGSYTLFPVVTNKSDQTLVGDRTNITVQ